MSNQVGEKVEFRPITSKDAETVRTIVFMAKLTDKHGEIRSKLTKSYEKNSSDIEVAFAFGLFNLLAIEKDDMMVSKMNIENALEAFDSIILKEPGYWLVRMLKSRLLLMLPSSVRYEEEVIEELESMIEIQKNSQYQPYFIIPYILLAEFYHSGGHKEKAEKYIKEAEELKREPVKILQDFLVLPFVSLENKLVSSGEYEMANRILGLGRDLFPDQYN
ncbi:hypothetical protein [Acetivibrio straminisolvens]|jgi:tetratricopeptide (TPR) repeat protein|uniref:Uncharacterized protein n=1 Tax=Acetivibrio straminisolvens JCM 21531 TaxID=1294263 RepID=W4V2Z1_9FIRM|nr:hypothetical protein [Acetivibrio straminisolvens]GAE87566.1 hypothetical protein JCM21531_944 [Acetivibrio straminisolvens JCM 21531]